MQLRRSQLPRRMVSGRQKGSVIAIIFAVVSVCRWGWMADMTCCSNFLTDNEAAVALVSPQVHHACVSPDCAQVFHQLGFLV